MYRHYHYILPLLLSLVLLSCETIAPDQQLITLEPTTLERCVLLTEFSGIGCVNCPTAQQLADDLADDCDGRLIVVQMHPAANSFTFSADPLYDYTTADADVYYSHFNGTATTPFPTGVVDFMKDGNAYFIDYTTWATAIHRRLNQAPTLSLDLTPSSEGDSYMLTAQAVNHATDALDFRLLYWLVEDSIEGRQLMPDGKVSTDYIHRHIFRGALNGQWGSQQSAFGKGSLTDVVDVSRYCYTGRHYSVVAVALSSDMSEVIAVAQTDLPQESQVQDEPFVLNVNGIGAIGNDTTIVVTAHHTDPITGKEEMEVRGSIIAEHIYVDTERSAADLDDQLCIGTCVNGNGETTQLFDFNVAGYSSWFAHYYPRDMQPAVITYRFYNNARSLRLTVKYQPED